jgi:hypothetical protein
MDEMDENERRHRLIRWLEVVKEDVEDLLLDQYLFWELQAIIEANPNFSTASGLLNQWMASSFVRATAVGVRRQAKSGNKNVSLMRFLSEVRQYPNLVTRHFYQAFFEDMEERNKPEFLN